MIRLLSTVLFLISQASAHNTVEIDNAVLGEPEVQCESDSISLIFNTKNPFYGKIFVKGYVGDSDCVQMGDSKNNHRFTVRHDGCGVRRQREINGVVIVSTVIVSFHSIFITKVDKAYRLSCFYVEATKKVQQQLDVAALTTETVEGQTQLPVCRYEILSDGPGGIPIKYARIGDTVYHKWTCVSELTDVYCMRVHSCTVYDGQGGPPVTVLDANGCSNDNVILQNLDYLTDLSAGKAAQVFKFADRTGLYFNCQIQLSIKDKQFGCTNSHPSCDQTYVEPSSKTTENSQEYNGSHESGYPTKSAEQYPTTKRAVPEDRYETSNKYDEKPTTSPLPPVHIRPNKNRLLVNVGAPSAEGEQHSGTGAAPATKPNSYMEVNPQEESTTDSSYTTSATDSYTRVRRSVLRSNFTPPDTVADFDLPERGIIVFGIEDDGSEHDGENAHSASFVFEDRSSKTCFTTTKMLSMFLVGLMLFTGLVLALSFIVFKQRKMISRSFVK